MTFNHTLLVLYAYDPIYRDCCTAFLRGIHSLSDILGFKKLVLKHSPLSMLNYFLL